MSEKASDRPKHTGAPEDYVVATPVQGPISMREQGYRAGYADARTDYEANRAEVAALRQQLAEARADCEHCGDMRSQLSAVEADLDQARAAYERLKGDRILSVVFGHHKGAPRPFGLRRREDVSGVSGTGMVALGSEFPDGTVVLRWTSTWPTSVVFHDRGIESVEAIHGHDGRTEIVWLSDELPSLAEMEQRAEAAEADRDRLLDVYRAVEAWANAPFGFEGMADLVSDLVRAVNTYRGASPGVSPGFAGDQGEGEQVLPVDGCAVSDLRDLIAETLAGHRRNGWVSLERGICCSCGAIAPGRITETGSAHRRHVADVLLAALGERPEFAAGVAAGRAQAAADIRASIPEVADYVWDASAPVQREIAAQIAEGGDPR